MSIGAWDRYAEGSLPALPRRTKRVREFGDRSRDEVGGGEVARIRFIVAIDPCGVHPRTVGAVDIPRVHSDQQQFAGRQPRGGERNVVCRFRRFPKRRALQFPLTYRSRADGARPSGLEPESVN